MKLQNAIAALMSILAIAVVQSGCEKKGTHDGKQKPDAHHHHTAPHGGALVVLGKEFAHLEFVLEESTGKLTGYVLDSEAEKPVRLTQNTIELKLNRLKSGQSITLQLKAAANVLTGETEGDTSQYEGQSDVLKGMTEFHAQIASIAVKGQHFTKVDFDFPEGNEGEHGEHHEH
ncbi:MAG: hypothetical protein OXP71_16565 [Candidatus Poribacteria bacterium]|nr:hypothetical protein [Candidatus Poribacteria bacterium]